MDSPSRLAYEDQAPQLFEPDEAELPPRRLTKAEALVYVRSIRARLHRAHEFVPDDPDMEHRRVA